MDLVLIDDILKGISNTDLKEKESACAKIVHMAKRMVPLISLAVARARRDNFGDDANKWSQWCEEHTLLCGSELHHRRAIGDMLLFTQEQNSALFEELFVLDCNKLLAITRISLSELKAFIAQLDKKLCDLSRDEVRNAVRQWIGETPKNIVQQLTFPGFDEVLKSAESLDVESLYDAVSNISIAEKSLSTGFKFVGASLEYLKRNKDFHALKSAKESLLSEILDIEQAMKECNMSHSNGIN